MPLNRRITLSLMMFIQYFIWGSWYVTLSSYLFSIGFDGVDVGVIYSAIPIGAIISPFLIGLIADRYFSAQRVLGVVHLVSAILLFLVKDILNPDWFFWILLAHAICYMSTIPLTNTIGFGQMKDPGKEFPFIRVFGTIGWILSGILISILDLEESNTTLLIASIASILLGLFSFSLPDTPPQSKGKKVSLGEIIGIEALSLFKSRSFAVFFLSSFLLSIPLAFYYNFTNPFLIESGIEDSAAKMSMGQASEILFMLIMPYLFIRWGIKKMMLAGMIAWTLRYVFFAFGNEELVFLLYGGILLHGICYDFFFVTGQIYVEKKAPKAIQASAQGLITLVTYGLGMLIGSWFSGYIVDYYTLNEMHLWKDIWLVPMLLSAATAITFIIFFKERNANPTE